MSQSGPYLPLVSVLNKFVNNKVLVGERLKIGIGFLTATFVIRRVFRQLYKTSVCCFFFLNVSTCTDKNKTFLEIIYDIQKGEGQCSSYPWK